MTKREAICLAFAANAVGSLSGHGFFTALIGFIFNVLMALYAYNNL